MSKILNINFLIGDLLLNFGRTPRWNCPIPESDAAVGASNDEEEEIEAPVHSSLSPSAVRQYMYVCILYI